MAMATSRRTKQNLLPANFQEHDPKANNSILAFLTNVYVLGYLLGNNLFYFKDTNSVNSVLQIYFRISFNK